MPRGRGRGGSRAGNANGTSGVSRNRVQTRARERRLDGNQEPRPEETIEPIAESQHGTSIRGEIGNFRAGPREREIISNTARSVNHSIRGENSENNSIASSQNTSVRRAILEARAAEMRYQIQSRLLEEKAKLEIELVNQQLARDLANDDDQDLRSIITRRSQHRHVDDRLNDERIHDWLQHNDTQRNDGSSETQKINLSGNTSGSPMRLAGASEESSNITQRLLQRATVGKRLPTFEGDVLEWPCFKRAFNETSKAGGFSEEENLMRLYESLKGIAKDAVSSLMVTSNDSKQIIDLLELRFGNPNAIASRIIDDIKALPKLYSNNSDLITFATKIKNCVAALEAASHIGYLHSHELIREITQKLPYAMIYNYNRYLNDNGKPNEPALITLSKFLFFEAEIACKAGTFDRSWNTQQKKRESGGQQKDRNLGQRQEENRGNKRPWQQRERTHATTEKTESGSPAKKKKNDEESCSLCDTKSHSIVNCERFINLSVADRWAWVRENKRCFKCLKSSSHQQNSCSETSCSVSNCSQNHHKLLHRYQRREDARNSRSASFNAINKNVDTKDDKRDEL